ncbi:MAG: hypothetical protein KJ831_04435 [Candidatus Eisenbacteria bacterium]|nr:hypothetical protein [Candidatus Eisenbacteria bacterium]
MEDCNWLYSAISQSCAAIVGIFGAFILTKIVGAQASFSGRKDRLVEFQLRTKRLLDEARNCYFSWYNDRRWEMAYDTLESTLEREKEFKPSEIYYFEFNYSPFQPKDDVLKAIERTIAREKARRKADARRSPLESSIREQAALGRLIRPKQDTSISASVESEREKIDLLEIKIRDHCRALEFFIRESRRNPEASRLVTGSAFGAIILFFVGVIWPLSFLPIRQDESVSLSIYAFFPTLLSLKGVILSAVSMIFVVGFALFVRINNSLRLQEKSLADIGKYDQVESYSEYFRIKKDNIAWWSEREKAEE